MGSFTVDADSLATTSATMRNTAAAIAGEVQNMHAQLEGLQSSWQGSASAAFAHVAQQWRTAQRSVEEALDSIVLALDSASAAYADTEARVMQAFAQ